MKTFLFTAACVLLAAAAAPAQTSAKVTPAPTASNEEANIRAYIELLRTDVRKSKSQILGAVMQLDAAAATKFWPIYKEYETEYATLGDQIVAVIRDYVDHYESMTNGVADKLASQMLNIEQQRNALKKKYYARVKAGLGAITATRFLQVENQLERLVDLQISAQLPVISAP